MDEDGSIVIILEAFDPNGDVLTYMVTSSPDNGVLNGWGSDEFIYIPDENFNGTDSFTFTVNDGTWTSGVGVVTINVLPVNDAPVLEFISEQNIDEDDTFLFSIIAMDVDFDALDFEVSIDGNADLSFNDNDLVISPLKLANGAITKSLSLKDKSAFPSIETSKSNASKSTSIAIILNKNVSSSSIFCSEINSKTGASLTGRTLIVTTPTPEVQVPSLTVKVKLSVPLKFSSGI
jgi:hypothetical protein